MLDNYFNKIINADLNRAKNILQIINKTKKKWAVGFKKLNNPIKVAVRRLEKEVLTLFVIELITNFL